MKTRILGYLLFGGLIFVSGIIVGEKFNPFNLVSKTRVEEGQAKIQLPPIGSVIRVDAAFDDGAFVGVYAGKRSYYKAPLTINGRVAIVLEAGKAYEVVMKKSEVGREYIALTPIL